MLFNVAVQFEGAYLLVVASGSAALAELCALADFAATVASFRKCDRALFDMLAVCNQMTLEERFQLGNHIASSLSGLQRVAAVLPTQEALSRGAGDVAVDRGLPLRMFAHLKDAEDWLLELPPAQ
jgi:hypothetical protein